MASVQGQPGQSISPSLSRTGREHISQAGVPAAEISEWKDADVMCAHIGEARQRNRELRKVFAER